MVGRTWALLQKNLRLNLRRKRPLLAQFMLPLYFSLLLWWISSALDPTATSPEPLSPSLSTTPFFLPTARVAYAPMSDFFDQVMRDALPSLQATLGRSVELEAYASRDELGGDTAPENLWAAVLFSGSLSNITMTIRMAATATGTIGPQVPPVQPTLQSIDDCHAGGHCSSDLYFTSGFLLLQRAVSGALYANLKSTKEPLVFPVFETMPRPGYQAHFSDVNRAVFAMFFVMAFSPLVQFLMVNVVSETEKEITPTFRRMGMGAVPYWCSWFISYAVMASVPALVVSIFGHLSPIFSNSSFFALFLLLYTFGLALVAMALLVTTAFRNSKVAGSAGALSTTIASLAAFVLNKDVPNGIRFLLALFPPCAAVQGVQAALLLADSPTGFQLSTMSSGGDFTPADAVIMHLVAVFLYLGLAILKWKPFRLVPRPRITMPLPTEDPQHDEGFENPIVHGSPDVELHAISKVYEDGTVALRGITLSFGRGHIFAILGHNGAGKSTLNNIITGADTPSKGLVTIFSQDMVDESDRERVQAMIGFCPQQDVIIDVLTVREHLELCAAMRQCELTEESLCALLDETDLRPQIDTAASVLSGGQKRKLSLAMALVGDPPMLCLDEPTSGMDPASRRKVWTLLQARKANRVILLMTHYMDEADILADTKAVISAGRVQCCGSSLYLKARFGRGHVLSLQHAPECQIDTVLGLIQTHAPGSRVLQDRNNELQVALPDRPAAVATLLECLEKTHDALHVTAFSVSLPSLEEVFLRLQDGLTEELLSSTSINDPSPLLSSSPLSRRTHHNDDLLQGEESVDDSEDRPLLSGPDDARHGTSHAPPPLAFAVLPPLRPRDTSFGTKVWALAVLRFKLVFRNWRALFFQVVLPPILLTIGLVVQSRHHISADGPPSAFVLDPAAAPLPLAYAVAGNRTQAWLPLVNQMNASASEIPNVPDWSSYLQSHGGLSAITLVNLTGQRLATASIIHNASVVHAAPVATHTLFAAAYAAFADTNFTLVSHPFLGASQISFDGSVFASVLLMGIALSLIPGGFAIDVVRDRTLQMKRVLLLAGVPVSAYWAGLLVSCCALFVAPVAYALVLVQALPVASLTGVAYLPTVLAFLFYVPMSVLFAFVLSYLFTDHDVCQSVLPPLMNFISFIPFVIISALDGTGNSSIAQTLHYVLSVLDPGYTLLGALYYVFRVQLVAAVSSGSEPVMHDYFAVDNIVLPTLLIMLFHSVWMAAAVVFLEKSPSLCRSQPPPLLPEDAQEEDVLVEENRLRSDFNAIAHNEIYVMDLQKQFRESSAPCGPKKWKAAVKGVSFGVRRGEVLGLLGPNGAGKTTTLSVLTGDLAPTHGRVAVAGVTINEKVTSGSLLEGFCPQHHALWPLATVEEHLSLLTTLRGISKAEGRRVVLAYADQLQMRPHLATRAERLSGGTKRKLNVALALLAGHYALLLDEPSSGMDPRARRGLWGALQACSGSRAIVLSTHAMDEADAVCNTIAMLVAGKLRAYGSPSRLKSKLGNSYTLEFHTPAGREAAVLAVVQAQHPAALVEEQFAGYVRALLPADGTQLSGVFRTIDACRAAGASAHGFSATTLEQVFLRCVREHDPAQL
eukprot:m.35933 g.35933  ORF g.35933 m.35933 type:complete len:1599 (-) comp9627_c1_seq2:26-4822(-)